MISMVSLWDVVVSGYGGADGPAPQGALQKVPSDSSRRSRRGLVTLATLCGLISAVLAIAVPFLPVTQQIVDLQWPTAQGTRAVSAPLTAVAPVKIDARIPCPSIRDLEQRVPGPGTLFNTNPPNSDYGKLTGMSLTVDHGLLTLQTRGQQLGTVPVPDGNCTVDVHSDVSGTTATVGGHHLAAVHGDLRPQMTGIFSQLNSGQDSTAGLSVTARIDNRWASSATAIKWAAIAASVACFALALWAMHRMDAIAGRRPPRLAARRWWRLSFRDVVVLGVLVLWWLIGAMTADDGYFLTMARTRADAGYIGEYYRWFATADAPMAWHVDLYALMTKVSTATPWMRLPSLLMGIVCWFLISRKVLPRLGQQVRRSSAAGWAAGAVFLAFWMPYDNGLRPENLVAMFSLLSLTAVERAVATRRMLPAGVGLVLAAMSVGVNPHGLMAVLPFVVALKPLLKLVRRFAHRFGWMPVLATIAACGFAVLNLLFWDQTWAGAIDATKIRSEIGPSQKWYEELARYQMLFTPDSNGAMTRRFPVLLVLLCLAVCLVVLLRRGQIRGAALGPSRRMLGMSALAFVVLAVTPTKHTHHFGMLAAVGGALAALAALATSTTVLRSKRNRAVFFAGLMFVTALAATGPNAWWYVSSWGVPWYNMPPQVHGWKLSTFLLLLAGIALVVAFLEHVRLDEKNPPPAVVPETGGWEGRSRALKLGTAPLSIVCALLMLFEVGSLVKAIDKRWNTYTMGKDNIEQLSGGSCGLSDDVYVEQHPLDNMLQPSAQQPSTPAPGWTVPQDARKTDTPKTWLQGRQQGFTTDGGLPPETSQDPAQRQYTPPFQMGGPKAPYWGSYEPTGYGTGTMRTPWYPLPQRARDGKVPVVVAVAGQLGGANTLTAEFGTQTPEGFKVLDRRSVSAAGGPGWRDARLVVDGAAADADQVRLVASDKGLGAEAWFSFSAPRVPQLARLTDVVAKAPTFLDWSAAMQHPCLQPSKIHDGIAQMPQYRVSGGADVRDIGAGWSSPDAGGPFAWLDVATTMRELPTYLEGDVNRDWGSLYEIDPYVANALPAQAAERTHTETRSGLTSMGPLTEPMHLPGPIPNSNNRTDLPKNGREETSDKQ